MSATGEKELPLIQVELSAAKRVPAARSAVTVCSRTGVAVEYESMEDPTSERPDDDAARDDDPPAVFEEAAIRSSSGALGGSDRAPSTATSVLEVARRGSSLRMP